MIVIFEWYWTQDTNRSVRIFLKIIMICNNVLRTNRTAEHLFEIPTTCKLQFGGSFKHLWGRRHSEPPTLIENLHINSERWTICLEHSFTSNTHFGLKWIVRWIFEFHSTRFIGRWHTVFQLQILEISIYFIIEHKWF